MCNHYRILYHPYQYLPTDSPNLGYLRSWFMFAISPSREIVMWDDW